MTRSPGGVVLVVVVLVTGAGTRLFNDLLESRSRTVELAELGSARDRVLDAIVELNRPGNDVLGSQDVATERDKFHHASTMHALTRAQLASRVEDIGQWAPSDQKAFQGFLEKMDAQTAVLQANAEGVFAALDSVADLQEGHAEAPDIVRYKTVAGEAMARMDHGFTLALSSLRTIANHTNGMLLVELERERETTWSLAAVAALLPIMIFSSLYTSWRHRQKLEEKFTKRLRFTQFSIDHVADSIFWTSADGRIISVNDAACRSLDYDRDELLSMSMCNVDVDMSQRAWELQWRELRSHEALACEASYRRRNGDIVPVEVRANHLEFDGAEYSCMFVYDVSVRKRAEAETKKLEAELRQAHKMEAVGAFAGGIAHDFNNIIGAILGSAELVLDDLPPSGRQRDSLQRILDAGLRARNLVRQILTFSRHSESTREPLQIGSVVSTALELVRASVPAMVDIRENTAGSVGLAYADSTQIHQVVMNLCVNASQAMGTRGGVLEVGVDDVYVDSVLANTNANLLEGAYVRLSVSDTGCGVDASLLDRMFDPFFTTKSVDEGTGLGLAVVHGIVMQYGGAIVVSSDVGRGTTFDVYLPRYDGEEEVESAQREPVIAGSECVLLVDDEAPLVEVARQMLERLGYQVVAVGSSLEAVRVFRAQPEYFDVVVTDQAMPRMSGMDLARVLQTIRVDIPIVVTTGYSNTVTPESVKDYGVRGYVGKPYSSCDLGLAVRSALDGGSSLG